jgi:hypothetical protein
MRFCVVADVRAEFVPGKYWAEPSVVVSVAATTIRLPMTAKRFNMDSFSSIGPAELGTPCKKVDSREPCRSGFARA